MNIYNELNFTDVRPAVFSLQKTEKINVLSIGLKSGQYLKKHKTSLKTQLIMIKGQIEFEIENETHTFSEFDVYEIPVNIQHEVKGLKEENIFILIQEK